MEFLPKQLAQYQTEGWLGKGSFGKVNKAVNQNTHQTVAIEQIDSIDVVTQVVYREIYILRRLRHPSVIQLLDTFALTKDNKSRYDKTELMEIHRSLSTTTNTKSLPFNTLYLTFEIMDTTFKAYLSQPTTYLNDIQIQYMLFQILAGLQYIHTQGVIHRDLKSENVLLNYAHCMVKIADFGLSRIATSTVSHADLLADVEEQHETVEDSNVIFPALTMPTADPAPIASVITVPRTIQPLKKDSVPALPFKHDYTKHVVTRWYRAPEVILVQPYSTPVDVWSIGCIFGEMLGCTAGNKVAYGKRTALFPGSQCGQLSADRNQREGEAYLRQQLKQDLSTDNNNQLKLIFKMLGKPLEEDLVDIDPVIAEIIRDCPQHEGNGIERLLPSSVNTVAMDLLKRMLTFNPTKRISVKDALHHPFFDELKRQNYWQTYKHNCNEAHATSTPINEIDDSVENRTKNLVQELMRFN